MTTLLGYKQLNFRADGQNIVGIQLYLSMPEIGVEGQTCDKLFIREGTIPLPELTPNMLLNITYNRKGKPERIEAATKQINLSK